MDEALICQGKMVFKIANSGDAMSKGLLKAVASDDGASHMLPCEKINFVVVAPVFQEHLISKSYPSKDSE